MYVCGGKRMCVRERLGSWLGSIRFRLTAGHYAITLTGRALGEHRFGPTRLDTVTATVIIEELSLGTP